jgi:hypothetical protein
VDRIIAFPFPAGGFSGGVRETPGKRRYPEYGEILPEGERMTLRGSLPDYQEDRDALSLSPSPGQLHTHIL